MDNQDLFLDFLTATKSLERLYDKIQQWLKNELPDSPLIFYQPAPLEDFSFGDPDLVRPVVLSGQETPDKISVEKIKNNETGLLDLGNPLYHLEKNNRWFGAIETKTKDDDFFKKNRPLIVQLLASAVDYHHQSKQAIISRWYQQLSETLHSPEGYEQLYNFVTEAVSDLLETSEAGFYTRAGGDYKLEKWRGFEPEDKRQRRSVPGEEFTGLEIEQSGPVLTTPEENSETRKVFLPIRGESGQKALVVAYRVDKNLSISKLKKYLLETLSHLTYITLSQLEVTASETSVYYDRLTHLHTGDYFRRRLKQEIEKGKRYNLECSVFILDIDNFSRLSNDLGRRGSDAILREFARLLKSCFRDVDIPCRFTNDEFGVLFPSTGLEGAMIAARRFHSLVKKPIFKTEEKFINVEVSGGIAGYPHDGESAKKISKKARLALYEAKKTGKNKIVTTENLEGD